MIFNSCKPFKRKRLMLSMAIATLTLSAADIHAQNFQLGELEINFDSTFSLGTSWRVEGRNWQSNVGKANNANNEFDFSFYHPAFNPTPSEAEVWTSVGSYSTNSDAGNLNFDKNKAFSTIFKGTHELGVRKDNIGIFVRGMYFYDTEMSDQERAWTNPTSKLQNDPCRDDEASDQLCSDVRLLDAFIYGDFDIGEMPLSIRIGQQVISWGESTLISHGISELNPIDIARLRAPGAELREAFIPFGAAWGSLGVTENVNIEMFYQYQWEKTILPAPGSYFSNNDFAGDGGQYHNVQLGFAGSPDMDLDFLIKGLNDLGDMLRSGNPQLAGAAQLGYLAYPTKLTLRAPGNKAIVAPKDDGQYGIRLSWYLPELNDTELSFYHMNYHSRRPFFSGITANFTQSALAADLGLLATAEITEDNYTDLQAFSKVQLFYPGDIKLYAVSFNTLIGDTAVAGEFTYRQDEPFQIDDVELLFAAMPQQLANAGLRPEFNGLSQFPVVDSGEVAEGFVLSDTVQAQITLTHLFGPALGASQLSGLFEIGGITINDIPEQDVLRLNGPGTDRNGGIEGKEFLELPLQDGIETNPFPSKFAWGYRMVMKLDYSNVFAGINVSPRVVFSHDVNGITPDPLFLFIEDRKSIAYSLDFDYQSRWAANIGYNRFFGGIGTTNQMADRDFVSFSIKYSI